MSADLLRRLIEAGTPADLVAEVAMLAGEAAALERRRASDRERQATRRHVTSRDTADVTDVHVNGSPDKEPPQTPHQINSSTPPLKGSPPALLPEHVIEAWNAMAERCGLSKAKLTPERRRKLGTQIRRRTIEDWTEAIDAVERSSFLRGENDRGWRADFDFLLQPASFTKLTEGSYDRSAH